MTLITSLDPVSQYSHVLSSGGLRLQHEDLGKIQGRDAVHFFQLLFRVWAVDCDPSGSLLSKLFMLREGTDL